MAGFRNPQSESVAGGVAAADLQLNDDKDLKLGTDNDYQVHYDSANTRLELVTTDSDGAGADADVIRIEDGGTTVAFQGAVTAVGSISTTTGTVTARTSNATALSAGTAGSSYFGVLTGANPRVQVTNSADLSVNGNVYGDNANGPLIENAASSATNPTLVPDRASATAGIGGTGGDVSIITGGVERMNFDTAGIITTGQRIQLTAGAGDFSTLDSSGAMATNSLLLGTGADARLGYSTTQTPNATVFMVGTDSRGLLIIEQGDGATDFAHAQQTNPTIFVQSANAADTAEWISIAHDQTDAVVGTGQGDFKFVDDGGKGVATYIRTNTETLTFAAAPGDASKTTSALVPANVILLGITTRCTTTGTNGTSVSIGDGTDVDMFGATTGITAGTTTGSADYTALTRFAAMQAAFNVTITANGGNIFSGVWRVTAHYLDVSAATSN